jgi:hypothetical protein
VEDLRGTLVLGLPFVYSLVTIVACIVLVVHFEHRFRGFLASLTRPLFEALLAALAAGAGAYVFLYYASSIVVPSTSASILLQGFSAGIFGIVLATLAYIAVDSREQREVFASVAARIWRRVPEEGTLVASAEEHGTL